MWPACRAGGLVRGFVAELRWESMGRATDTAMTDRTEHRQNQNRAWRGGAHMELMRTASVHAGPDRDKPGQPPGPGTSVLTKTKPQVKRPNLYRVLLLNDDYTPMEFVVHVLERFFNKDLEAATQIMLHVHNHGIGECGIFTYEVAETKVTQVMDFARKHQHPLQCVMEKK